MDRLADGFNVEAWCQTDDIIEQMRLTGHPFVVGVQYHPERGQIYDALFEDFFSQVEKAVNRCSVEAWTAFLLQSSAATV